MDRGPSPASSEISLGGEGPMPADDLEARDVWLQQSVDTIGGDGFIDHRVVVPPGSVVVTHHQIFHRASRAEDGTFRPMVKLGAARISEPLPAEAAAADAETAEDSALLQAMRAYTQGQQCPACDGSADLDALSATLLSDPSDVVRLEAAHALAAAARAEGGGAALEALGAAFELHLDNEAASRNAMYGLCAVGPEAVGVATAVLESSSAAGQADEEGSGWKLACNAAHILGQTTTTPDTRVRPSLPTGTD